MACKALDETIFEAIIDTKKLGIEAERDKPSYLNPASTMSSIIVMIKTASLIYIKTLIRLLDNQGADLNEINNITGIDKLLKSANARESSDNIAEIWKQTAQYLDLHNLGLKTGINSHPADYGAMSYLWMNCSSFLEIMNYVCEYKPLLNEEFSAKIISNADGYEYILESSSSSDDSLLIEYDFASILHMGIIVAGKAKESQVCIQSIDFTHPPNTRYQDYEHCFNCKVRFSQKKNRMVLSSSVLEIPVISPKPAVRNVMLQLIEEIHEKELGQVSLSKKISNYIADKIYKGGRPTQNEASEYFGYSNSKLKRELNKEDLSYSILVAKVLEEISIKLLNDSKLSIEDISLVLGFSSKAAFTRSFKNWRNETPHQYRKEKAQIVHK